MCSAGLLLKNKYHKVIKYINNNRYSLFEVIGHKGGGHAKGLEVSPSQKRKFKRFYY